MASKKLKRALMAGLAGAALAGSAKMKGEALKKGSAAIGSDAVASGIKEKTGILSRVDDFFKKRVWKLINLCSVLALWMVLKLVR
jgi:hypothetical protein